MPRLKPTSVPKMRDIADVPKRESSFSRFIDKCLPKRFQESDRYRPSRTSTNPFKGHVEYPEDSLDTQRAHNFWEHEANMREQQLLYNSIQEFQIESEYVPIDHGNTEYSPNVPSLPAAPQTTHPEALGTPVTTFGSPAVMPSWSESVPLQDSLHSPRRSTESVCTKSVRSVTVTIDYSAAANM